LKPSQKKNGNGQAAAKANKRKTEIMKKTSNPHFELSGKAVSRTSYQLQTNNNTILNTKRF